MTTTLHIVCPHCHTTNRVQSSDLGTAPNCGQCHQMLFTGHPTNLDEASFERHVGRNQIPVLVDFWAPWCGPCKQMAPAYEQAAVALEPGVRVVKVDTDQAQTLAARYNIRSIPTLMLFANGQEIARRPGALGANDIVRWARSNLPSA